MLPHASSHSPAPLSSAPETEWEVRPTNNKQNPANDDYSKNAGTQPQPNRISNMSNNINLQKN